MATVLASRVAQLLALGALSSFALSGCFLFGGNPALGKWTLSTQTDGCPDSLEFTSTTMSATAAGIAASHDVTYKTSGGTVAISSADGFATTVTVSGNTLNITQPVQCTYTKS